MSADPQFQLQLLGGFALGLSSGPPDGIVISSKKARALLAYIAMQDPTRISRERLATLLWPDRIDRQARQNLRKCIASLRADLASHADELLLIDGETIGLSGVLVVDAVLLRKLSNTDRIDELENAATLYRGQFLSDLAMEGEEFRDWAYCERAQLDSAAGTILAKLASRADAAGDARKAVEVSSRLGTIDPLREDWQRLSLTITARHVGRDKALLQAKTFIGLLRKELDVEPEAGTTDLIEQIKAGRIATIRNRDAAIGDRVEYKLPQHPAADQAAAPPKSPTAVRADRHPAMATAIIAAIVAVLVASLSVVYGPGDRPGSLKRTSIGAAAIDQSTIPLLVMPVQSATAETTELAQELTDSLLTSASRFSGLTIFDGRSTPRARDQSDSQAERLGIRFSAWGSVRRQASTIRLDVGLSDLTNQKLVWADEVTESEDRVADLETEIQRRIARDLQVQAAYAEAHDLDGAEPKFAASRELIAKALTIQYSGSTLDDASATSLYQEVLRRDRTSSLALIGLAAELVTSSANLLSDRRSTLARAEKLIRQALQINPRIERAQYWLGNISLLRGQRDLALQSFERALELNPGFIPAEAHAGYTLVLLGRTNEGLKRIENALSANPHDPNERLWLRFAGIAELELGNDQQAIESLLEAAALAAPAPPLHAALASAYALTGRHSESRAQFRLLKETADPAALEYFLNVASRNDGQHGLRYLQGLRLAAGDTL